MLRHSVQALASHPAIAGVQVVIHPSHAEFYHAAVSSRFALVTPDPSEAREATTGEPIHSLKLDPGASAGVTDEKNHKLLPVVHGGAERVDSVRAGLAALAPRTPDYVLIHDAARPFLSHAIIYAIIEKLSPDHAVIPALAVVDTVRRLEGNGWSEVSRDGLFRVQTPQAFPFEGICALVNPSPSRGEDGRGAYGYVHANHAPTSILPQRGRKLIGCAIFNRHGDECEPRCHRCRG
jgi:2-C-methyl-D-erythritol 4-phosphate cytidylyltransferase